MNIRSIVDSFRETHRRYGWAAALHNVLHLAVNRVAFVECLHVIVLDRAKTTPARSDGASKFTSRLATREDLERMKTDPRWMVDDEKLAIFDAGDSCVLSLVDGRPAGYTWAHAQGRPELIPGLRIRVPPDYLYNFAGLTLPDFRGAGLQSYRHHLVLSQPQWRDRRGLLGYVRATNFASRHGQSKSGYRKVGAIWLVGSRSRFVTIFSKSLREMGVHRLAPPADRGASTGVAAE